MLVGDVMTRKMESVFPNNTVLQAAKKMRDLNVGAMPVVDEEGNFSGILTDRDIIVRVLADELNPSNTTVREVMTTNLQFCFEDTELEEAAKIMEQYQIRRILIKDSKGRPAGILSLGDLASQVKERLSGEVLREVSGG